jgi:ribonuclease HII
MIGLDEAGCGPGFGDLVASAVFVPMNVCLDGITDSKKMSDKKRNIFFQKICEECYFGIGKVTNKEIDSIGLGEARRLVFERALFEFEKKYPEFKMEKHIVDGTIYRQWKNVSFECIPKADSLYTEVSAASVIAKVTRDNDVLKLCKENPYLDEYYKISKNKGYLTQDHKKGILKHGKSVYHRLSYTIK